MNHQQLCKIFDHASYAQFTPLHMINSLRDSQHCVCTHLINVGHLCGHAHIKQHNLGLQPPPLQLAQLAAQPCTDLS